MSCKHLIDLNDFAVEDWKSIVSLAVKIRQSPADYQESCRGKLLATLFYEPSTRTRMSFQAAMLRLGGQVIGFDNPQNTSISKGESVKDTIRIVSGYVDLIAARSPLEGFARAASLYAGCPVINAGDGGHLHPTQTLTDLVTLQEEKGRLDHLVVGLCGDLKNGRTVHSLIKALGQFAGNRFILISTKELTLPDYLKHYITARGGQFEEIPRLEDAMPALDVLSMTRIQRERFNSPEEYARQKNIYVLDDKKMKLARPSLRVLHPLPRVDEIDLKVDNDPRAIYFDQAVYGMYARMSLILHLLNNPHPKEVPLGREYPGVRCANPNCIAGREPYLPQTFHKTESDLIACDYCDEQVYLGEEGK